MSTPNFADQLIKQMKRNQSRVIVGLDPSREHAPEILTNMEMRYGLGATVSESRKWAIREFCERIMEATSPVAAGFKLNIAFFERFGADGIAVLERLLEAHEDELIIIDAKRGDIGSTAKAYAEAFFHEHDHDASPLLCDAITLSPYLGLDSLDPYLKYVGKGKGVFVLAKTSNPGGADFQDLLVDGQPVYQHVAARLAALGEDYVGEQGYSSIGLVVGATQPEAARRIRETAPKAIFLVPGIGVQGGKVDDAAAFCNADGQGAVFNFSRSIIYACRLGPFADEHNDEQFAEAAHHAADYYRVRLNEALGEV